MQTFNQNNPSWEQNSVEYVKGIPSRLDDLLELLFIHTLIGIFPLVKFFLEMFYLIRLDTFDILYNFLNCFVCFFLFLESNSKVL